MELFASPSLKVEKKKQKSKLFVPHKTVAAPLVEKLKGAAVGGLSTRQRAVVRRVAHEAGVSYRNVDGGLEVMKDASRKYQRNGRVALVPLSKCKGNASDNWLVKTLQFALDRTILSAALAESAAKVKKTSKTNPVLTLGDWRSKSWTQSTEAGRLVAWDFDQSAPWTNERLEARIAALEGLGLADLHIGSLNQNSAGRDAWRKRIALRERDDGEDPWWRRSSSLQVSATSNFLVDRSALPRLVASLAAQRSFVSVLVVSRNLKLAQSIARRCPALPVRAVTWTKEQPDTPVLSKRLRVE